MAWTMRKASECIHYIQQKYPAISRAELEDKASDLMGTF